MANRLKMKQSSVAGKVPATTDLLLGELAVNTTDGKLYLKKNVSGTETIVDVTAGGLLPATATGLGGVKGLTNLTIDAAGNLSLSAGNIATALGYTPLNMPSGTAMLFAQTAAPTGWTKSTAHNDKALRVVSGTAGSGGSVGFSSAFASRAVNGSIANTTSTGSVGNTTLTAAQVPNQWAAFGIHAGEAGTIFYSWSGCATAGGVHTNTYRNAQPAYNGAQSAAYTIGFDLGFGNGAHNHSLTMNPHNHTFTGESINMAVQYVDVIIATKD